jgi:prepilin-type N-terminal cleavage/methylation domain-containing protein
MRSAYCVTRNGQLRKAPLEQRGRRTTHHELRTTHNAQRITNNAFTLVELIISVAILSIGLVVVLQGLTNSLNILKISQNNLESTFMLDEKMSELELKREEERELNRGFSEEFTSGGIEFKWNLILSNLDDLKQINKATGVLFWKEGRRQGKIEAPTYLRTSLEPEEQ